MTNRELFRQVIEKVKALNGTAQAKADLFEAEARKIEAATGGAWKAQRLEGLNGEHIFVGKTGEMLVIDVSGNLFRGSLDLAFHSFIPPNKIRLDYNHLNPIN